MRPARPAPEARDLHRENVDLLVYATRYALGRRTYAVSDVTEAIKRNIDSIPNGQKQVLAEDIRQARDRGDKGLGDGCDKERWLAALALLEGGLTDST